MSYRWVRASEIAEYDYCRRSWWLKQLQGARSHNVQQLKRGTRHHQRHGRLVSQSRWAHRLAYAVLFVVVMTLAFHWLSG